MSDRTQDTLRSVVYFRLQDFHLLWSAFPNSSANKSFSISESYNPIVASNYGLGLVRFRSPLLSESHLMSFPRGTKMVQFSRFVLARLCFRRLRYTGITLYGFPHSEIFGSKLVCSSPKLFAAYHVFHRLLVP